MNLRICHLGKFYPPARGGIETHLHALAQGQAELGADVQVVCINHLDRTGQDATWRTFARTGTDRETDGRVRVTRLGRSFSLARFDVSWPFWSGAWKRIGGVFDILHLHIPNPSFLVPLALRFPAGPLVVTHHSDTIRQRYLKHLVGPFEARVYQRASRILATGPGYLSESALLRRHHAKVEILPLGLDLQPFLTPSKEALAFRDRLLERHGRTLWLCVGRFVYYKGFHTALEALVTSPGALMLVGCGPLERELVLLAESLGVSSRVDWRPELSPDELAGAYMAATALWFPSNARSEGFGLVQVEAMASACPVINTRIPGSSVDWVSRNEETGLTVPMNNPGALALAARRLIEEPGLRDRLAAAARERARSEFDYRLMARRSLEIYQRAVEGRMERTALTTTSACGHG